MIKFSCENCGQKFHVTDNHAGQKGRCPKCKSPLQVPEQNSNGIPDNSKPELLSLLEEPDAASLKEKNKDESPLQDSDYIQMLAQIGNSPTTTTLTESKPSNRKPYWYDTRLGEILFRIVTIVQVISMCGVFFIVVKYNISIVYFIIVLLLSAIIQNGIFFSWVLTQPKKKRSKILRISVIIFVIILCGNLITIGLYIAISAILLPLFNGVYVFGFDEPEITYVS